MSARSNPWYFGDYDGNYPGRNYNLIIYSVTVLLFINIAFTTEMNLISSRDIKITLEYFLDIVEIFFISDFIGKVANSWSIRDYRFRSLLDCFIKKRAIFDLFSLMALLLPILAKESPILLIIYIAKIVITIYESELKGTINRLNYILFNNPSNTFFPIILLLVFSYFFATLMYLIEKTNDPTHFGSIVRSFWFSFTMLSFAFDGIIPQSLIGKVILTIFGILGIICIALLTANIIDSYNEYDSLNKKDP